MIDPKTLDAATVAHLTHGAMAGADPLTDSLLAQLVTASIADDAPPSTMGSAGLTAAQLSALAEAGEDPLLDVLIPLGVGLGMLLSAAYPMGWLAWVLP